MFRLPLALIGVTLLTGSSLPAAAQSASPRATGVMTSQGAHNVTHHQAFGNKVRVHGSSASRPLSAAACTGRTATLPGSGGTLGPNGASASQTLVAVPLNGANVPAATRRQQIAEACGHVRR